MDFKQSEFLAAEFKQDFHVNERSSEVRLGGKLEFARLFSLRNLRGLDVAQTLSEVL